MALEVIPKRLGFWAFTDEPQRASAWRRGRASRRSIGGDLGSLGWRSAASWHRVPGVVSCGDITMVKNSVFHQKYDIHRVYLCVYICINARIKTNNFRESFANPTFIFRGGLMLKSFAKSFAQTKYFRKLRKNCRGWSHVGTLAAFVMDNLYMDL